jgi:hypothetical protein
MATVNRQLKFTLDDNDKGPMATVFRPLIDIVAHKIYWTMATDNWPLKCTINPNDHQWPMVTVNVSLKDIVGHCDRLSIGSCTKTDLLRPYTTGNSGLSCVRRQNGCCHMWLVVLIQDAFQRSIVSGHMWLKCWSMNLKRWICSGHTRLGMRIKDSFQMLIGCVHT